MLCEAERCAPGLPHGLALAVRLLVIEGQVTRQVADARQHQEAAKGVPPHSRVGAGACGAGEGRRDGVPLGLTTGNKTRPEPKGLKEGGLGHVCLNASEARAVAPHSTYWGAGATRTLNCAAQQALQRADAASCAASSEQRAALTQVELGHAFVGEECGLGRHEARHCRSGQHNRCRRSGCGTCRGHGKRCLRCTLLHMCSHAGRIPRMHGVVRQPAVWCSTAPISSRTHPQQRTRAHPQQRTGAHPQQSTWHSPTTK